MVCAACPRVNAPGIAGSARDAKIAIIEITTKSSIRVKAVRRLMSFMILRVELDEDLLTGNKTLLCR
jgi:hypothetical protein